MTHPALADVVPLGQRRDPREYLTPEWRKSPSFVVWEAPVLPWEVCDAQRRAALRLAWGSGDLRYKLDPEQERVYLQLREWLQLAPDERGKRFVLDVARRWGKSSLMFLIANEERLRKPRNRRIAYWCDTNKMCEEIIMLEVFPWLFDDCPPELRPTWYPSRHRIIWDRDSKTLDLCRSIELAGLDDPNRARGRSLYFGVVDEGAFIPDLEYIDKSVLSKMMLTVPDAALVLGSTPPVTPAHYWTTELCARARAEGSYHHGTIYDVPRLSDAAIAREIEDTGGPLHSTTRRELYAEHTPDEAMSVLPEADEAVKSGAIFHKGGKYPAWRNCYVAMDPGWSDATAVLFAHVDFERQKLVVESEWLATQATSGVVAEAIKIREGELWNGVRRWSRSDGGGPAPNPHRRWTDIDKRLVADLQHDHRLSFSFTQKSDLAQQIVRVRNWVLDETLEISPECPQLLEQMRHAVYKNITRKAFDRQGRFGHFDLVAALVYLCRNAEPVMRRNPNHPKHYQEARDGRFYRSDARPVDDRNRAMQVRNAQQAQRMQRLRHHASAVGEDRG